MSRQPGNLLAIAHRSGNSVVGLRSALALGVDLVEADVHAYRGLLEIRHHKSLGPRHLWDKWEVVRRTAVVRLELADLLIALGGDPRLMLDLKGVRPGLAPAVAAQLRATAPGVPLTVCSKHWWMLARFEPPVRTVPSASSRMALARLRRRLRSTAADGVSIHLRLLTPDLVAELRARVPLVMTWPVDDAAALERARALGVDAVISKDLTLLSDVVRGPDQRS